MGLEEGFIETAYKGGGKIRIGRPCEQRFKKRKTGGFEGGKNTEPFLFLGFENPKPAVELGKGNGEAFAELFHSGEAQEILRQDTEDEEQAITGVGNDKVGENGMGMAAGADQAEDAEIVADNGTVYKIGQGTAIVSMDPAGAFRATAGAGLKFRAETTHEGIKQCF